MEKIYPESSLLNDYPSPGVGYLSVSFVQGQNTLGCCYCCGLHARTGWQDSVEVTMCFGYGSWRNQARTKLEASVLLTFTESESAVLAASGEYYYQLSCLVVDLTIKGRVCSLEE